MAHDWKELTELTQGAAVGIERIRIKIVALQSKVILNFLPLPSLPWRTRYLSQPLCDARVPSKTWKSFLA